MTRRPTTIMKAHKTNTQGSGQQFRETPGSDNEDGNSECGARRRREAGGETPRYPIALRKYFELPCNLGDPVAKPMTVATVPRNMSMYVWWSSGIGISRPKSGRSYNSPRRQSGAAEGCPPAMPRARTPSSEPRTPPKTGCPWGTSAMYSRLPAHNQEEA